MYKGLPPELQRRLISRLPDKFHGDVRELLYADVRKAISEDFYFWYGLDVKTAGKLLKNNDGETINIIANNCKAFEGDKFSVGLMSKADYKEFIGNLYYVLLCLPKEARQAFLGRIPQTIVDLILKEISATLKDEGASLDAEPKMSEVIQTLLRKIEMGDDHAIKTMVGIINSDYDKTIIAGDRKELSVTLRVLNNALSNNSILDLIRQTSEQVQNEIYDIVIWAAVTKSYMGRSHENGKIQAGEITVGYDYGDSVLNWIPVTIPVTLASMSIFPIRGRLGRRWGQRAVARILNASKATAPSASSPPPSFPHPALRATLGSSPRAGSSPDPRDKPGEEKGGRGLPEVSP